MKLVPLSLFLLIAGFNIACNGRKEDRPVSSFTKLNVGGGIDVYLTQSNSEKLTIDAKSVDEDQVISEVKNGTLKLYVERKKNSGWPFGRNNNVTAHLTFRQLKDINASEGAYVFSKGRLIFNDLDAKASGGANIVAELQADTLTLTLSDGAEAIVEGSAHTFDAMASAGATIKASKFVVENCTANASTGSKIDVSVSKKLSMNASLGSTIHYTGSANVLTRKETMGSTIKRK